MNAKRRAVETRLLGAVVDLLTVVAYSHAAKGRAFWVCQCNGPCGGTTLVRSSKDMNKNRERNRKNGCDVCVPSQRITVLNQVHRMTREERSAAAAESRRRYEAKRANEPRGRAQRRKRYGDPNIERIVLPESAYVWNGKVVGEAHNDIEREWLRRVFG